MEAIGVVVLSDGRVVASQAGQATIRTRMTEMLPGPGPGPTGAWSDPAPLVLGGSDDDLEAAALTLMLCGAMGVGDQPLGGSRVVISLDIGDPVIRRLEYEVTIKR